MPGGGEYVPGLMSKVDGLGGGRGLVNEVQGIMGNGYMETYL